MNINQCCPFYNLFTAALLLNSGHITNTYFALKGSFIVWHTVVFYDSLNNVPLELMSSEQ